MSARRCICTSAQTVFMFGSAVQTHICEKTHVSTHSVYRPPQAWRVQSGNCGQNDRALRRQKNVRTSGCQSVSANASRTSRSSSSCSS